MAEAKEVSWRAEAHDQTGKIIQVWENVRPGDRLVLRDVPGGSYTIIFTPQVADDE